RQLAAQIDAPTSGAGFLRLAETTLPRYAGAVAEAITRLEAVMAVARRSGDLVFQIAGAWELSAVLLDHGAWERAQAVLEAVLPLSDRDVMFGRAWPRYRLSRVAVGTGDLALAHRLGAEADSLVAAGPP